MKIGVVNNFSRINPTRAFSLNNSRKISFGAELPAVETDSFIKQENACEFDILLKKHDELLEQIKKEVAIHKEKNSDIPKKVYQMQRDFNLAHDDNYNFASLKASCFGNNLLAPLSKAYQNIKGLDLYAIQNIEFDNHQFCGDGGFYLFKSKNKEIADEAASLYPFYLKALASQNAASKSAEAFKDAYIKRFWFNKEELTPPKELINAPRDEKFCCALQDKMEGFLEGVFEKNMKNPTKKEPFFYVIKDFEPLVDEAKNSPSNIAAMKNYLNNSISEFGAVVLASAKDDLPSTTEGGILMTNRCLGVIDLDELGVTKEQTDYLRKCKENLEPEIEKFEKLYKKLNLEDRNRLRKINDLMLEFKETGINIVQKFCPDNETKTKFTEIFNIEAHRLDGGIDFEPVKKGDFVSPVENIVQEVQEKITEEIKAAPQEIPYKNNKKFALIAGLCALGLGVILTAKKYFVDNVKENSTEAQ